VSKKRDNVNVSNSEHVISSVEASPGILPPDKVDESQRIRREMRFLALDPSQSERLRTKKMIHADRFPCGLVPHSDDELQQQGQMKLRQFASAMCLCTTKQADEGIIPPNPNILDAPGMYSLGWPKSSVQIEYHDIHIDERVLTLLENSEASDRDDPYHLRNRSPGVYVLYRAATRYYEPRKLGLHTREQVEAWVNKQLPALYLKTIVRHAVKLIDPNHKRGSGSPSDGQKVFDPALLSDGEFRGKYLTASFVNEALALIFYVTHWWLEESKNFEEGKLKKRPTRLDVEEKLGKIGFYQKEREALTRVITWPDR
jgi:hypothetical protein